MKNGDASIKFVKPQPISSQAWSNFSCVFYNNYKQKFVSCDNCKDILSHTSSNGTSSMTKHYRSCTKAANYTSEQKNIKEYFSSTKSRSIPKKVKEKITIASAEFAALDNRPFHLLCGDGFQNFAQAIFDAGKTLYNTSNISIEDLLPHPATVSRNIDKIFNYRNSQLIDLCKAMKSYTVVVDFWTESHTGIHYCGIALNHINSELQFQSFVLGCYPYDHENHNASQIRQFVDSKLTEYGLILDNQKFVVTDNENRMKAAFKDSCCRVGCAIHYVNKQLEHTFTTKEINKIKVNCDIVQQMFSNIRKIVAHVTRSHKQCKLSHKLQSYSETRFNGAFVTMDIFLLVFDELISVMDLNFINYYLSIDKELLECVCCFLKIFEQTIEELSKDTEPTIYKVLPLREYLLNHCQVNADDYDGLKEIKIFLKLRIEDVWILHGVHYITTLLHPLFKNFRMNPHLKTKAIDLVKNEILKRHLLSNNNNSSTIAASVVFTSTSDIPSINSNSLLSKCFDLPTTTQKLASTSFDELDEYLNLNVEFHDDDDILIFWSQHQSKFPIIASIVQDYYAIPASNTVVERLFSSSKNTISDRRTRLDTGKVNKLLFLQKNLSVLKSFDKIPVKEVVNNHLKRKTTEPSSTLFQDQEQTMTADAKKIKPVKQDHIVICDDNDSEQNKENDDSDLF
ncbi:unnamed protein product [Rotaria magnacalcarata]|uniref:HAT C-terminal dimerisation domain-containing protein n=1 Tax=Rotaria magnacalcarata TaxID=392030 RepID=A0A816GTF6_9BILA|nr:unnamed protein product [Rotaria magnacalcarata]